MSMTATDKRMRYLVEDGISDIGFRVQLGDGGGQGDCLVPMLAAPESSSSLVEFKPPVNESVL